VDVSASRDGRVLRTTARVTGVNAALTIGAVLPDGASVGTVRLDGRSVPYQVVRTARGAELRVDAGTVSGSTTLMVTLR
jgi:hypothetical protein